MPARPVYLFLLIVAAPTWPAAPTCGAEPKVEYLREIKPLLAEKCYSCHGVLKQESGLRLETRSLMMDASVVQPGNPDASLLMQRVLADDAERMPPPGEGAALTNHERSLLRRWIEQGAVAPEESVPQGPESHWAFSRIERPRDRDASLPDSVDGFLTRGQQAKGLQPLPPAPRPLQIRRLYLDLIGLPPTEEQLSDDRSWSVLVDELLASPHHGERWARHWMDVWRYSDGYGLNEQLRYSQHHLWHWRDWIVDSLNADKGYDRMVLEMLAGDELTPGNADVVAGTGFLARNYYLFNRTTWLDNTIEHSGKAFLGLTLNCAKCHDHKYDPITQLDYYRFRAIFEPHQVRLDPVPGQTDFARDGLPRVFDDDLEQPTYLHRRGDPKNPATETEIPPGVPALFSDFQPPIKPIDLPRTAFDPGMRDYVLRDRIAAAEKQVRADHSECESKRQQLRIASERSVEEAEPAEPDFLVLDDFTAIDDSVWELVGEGWEVRDGALRQTQSTRDGQFARLKKTVPEDFELRCRYTTTGGTTYKSVTFRFDESEDREESNSVYSSAHEPGPKVQISHTRRGKTTYPAAGRKAIPISVGKAYELRFAVRGNLVNVWLDQQLLLAYQLPSRSPTGRFSLSGFDATVAFDRLEIRSLDASEMLVQPGETLPLSIEAARREVKVAEAKLAVSTANLAALRAVEHLATAQRRVGTDDPSLEPLRRTVLERQAEELRAIAARDLIENQADPAKREAAQKRFAESELALQKARTGAGQLRPIRGAKKALESPADKESEYPAVYPSRSSGRRLALARWIVSRENPLTARVAVNHVWMRHFGEPLVESVFDFGLRAPEPIHRDLLDYLAVELIESGWSFRHLHRLIVTSQAYRRASSSLEADSQTVHKDPANLYYWRMNTRRMEAQAIRDSLLMLAGQLDLQMGGPSVGVGPSSRRRSLYFKHSRDDHDQFLTMFDDADLLQCYRRDESIVPQQALALSNSELSLSMAQLMSDRWSQPGVDDASFASGVFFRLLARKPTEPELERCVEFLQQTSQLSAGTNKASASGAEDSEQLRARRRLVHALLSHNDFISIR
ncbi:DUF1553 domain-containing protein [Roseiconus nitratireducens]|uniref:DUF1553 domain-containing protein n=1 Tax=Roseiconus nitratireducens TaxID=2605748 RepID=UPI001375856F|nr:DUF1553 domain-containing protein [Roseiconus nitratireducens]